MKAINEFILEKILISKDTQITPNNEEVLVMYNEHNNGWPLRLFINGIETFYNKYKKDDVDLNLQLTHESKTIGRTSYYMITDFIPKSNILNIKVIKSNKINKDTEYVFNALNHYVHSKKQCNTFKFFLNNIIDEPWLYLWYSENDKRIRIHISDKPYEELLKKGFFNY